MKCAVDRDFRDAMRWEFALFAEQCFRHLYPNEPFIPGWHIDLLASWLTACNSPGQRMIINLPPRHLKSLLGSVALVAWLLGHNPGMKIICASYGQELSEQFSLQCRSVMESRWYRRLFPRTRLARVRNNELTTTAHGFRLATSVDGPLTGRGADLIIIDDPIKPDEALSDTVRRKVNAWFHNTLYSRLNDKKCGRILVLMQRLHEDDLTGHLLTRGKWNHLVLPAVAEQETTHHYMVFDESRTYTRTPGEALHPARESLETLDGIRGTIGEYNFAGQYQQKPAPREGGMVKRGWFRSYEPRDLPAKFDLLFQSWDTANKPSELSDYSVCTTWGVANERIYLLHVLRKKLAYPDLKRAVREQAEIHKAGVVLIEDKASGTQLIQELKEEKMRSVTPYKPEAGLNKQMRLHAQTGVIENGLVYLPKEAEWLDGYLHELTIFPASTYDDQVDSTAQALHWIKTGQQKEPGIIGYYRMLNEQLQEEQRKLEQLVSGETNGLREVLEYEECDDFNTVKTNKPYNPGMF